ncbi:phage major capsid protein [Methylobacterium fujisawaense]
MAYPVSNTPYGLNAVSPNPPYSGTFIPEIWSAKLLEKFYASTVLAAISNTDYEGEITGAGDKLIIRTRPTLTIKNYSADQPLEFERPSAPTVSLLIDKGKYFAAILDDVMKKQMDIDVIGMWTDDASQQMKLTIDRDMLLYLLGQADANNRGAVAGAISHSLNLGATGAPVNLAARNPGTGEVDVIEYICRLGQVLDEQNIPEEGRWIVAPSWFGSYIKQSDLRNAGLSGDSVSTLRNGKLGMIDRFTIYISNLLPTSATATGQLAASEFPVFAGHRHSTTFASQITEMETIRSESTFGDIIRGLNVYGFKVLDKTCLVQGVVTQ